MIAAPARTSTPDSIAPAEPSTRFAVALLLGGVAVQLAISVVWFAYRRTLPVWGDNWHYVAIADAIHAGRWPIGPDVTYLFWGMPFVMAGISALTGMSTLAALIVISVVSSVIACVLIRRLYGGWVACAAIAVGLMWIEVTARGGTEPYFMALVYGALAARRRRRMVMAGLLAGLAATVRPVGVIAIAALELDAVLDRDWKTSGVIGGLAVAIGLALVAAVAHVAGNPVRTIEAYTTTGGWAYVPLGWPFQTLGPALLDLVRTAPLIGIRVGLWIAAALSAIALLWRRRPGDVPRTERLFLSMYAAFFLCATYVGVALYFARFILPAAPLIVAAYRDLIPRRPVLFWIVTVVSAAAGAVASGRILLSLTP